MGKKKEKEVDPQIIELFDGCEHGSLCLLKQSRSGENNALQSTATESSSPTRGVLSRKVKNILGSKTGITVGGFSPNRHIE